MEEECHTCQSSEEIEINSNLLKNTQEHLTGKGGGEKKHMYFYSLLKISPLKLLG
jgi:hypothetical protein